MGTPGQPPPDSAPPGDRPPAAERGVPHVPIDRLVVALTLGVGVTAAGLWMSITSSRPIAVATFPPGHTEGPLGDLDVDRWLLGVLAGGGLLAVAILAAALVRDPAPRRLLTSYPGAVAAVGLGSLVALLELDIGTWFAGLVTAALGFLVWRLQPSTPPLVAAALGILAFCVKGAVELALLGESDAHIVLWAAPLLWVVITAVSAFAWTSAESPATRDTVVVTVGALGALGSVALMVVANTQEILSVLGGSGPDGMLRREPKSYDLDLWVTLILTLLAVAAWCWCWSRSQHSAYRLLVVGTLAVSLPFGVTALTGGGDTLASLMTFSVVGVGVVAAVLVLVVSSSRSGAPAAPPSTPSDPDQPG